MLTKNKEYASPATPPAMSRFSQTSLSGLKKKTCPEKTSRQVYLIVDLRPRLRSWRHCWSRRRRGRWRSDSFRLLRLFLTTAHRPDLDHFGFETAIGRLPVGAADFDVLHDIIHRRRLCAFGNGGFVRDLEYVRCLLACDRERLCFLIDARNHSVERQGSCSRFGGRSGR